MRLGGRPDPPLAASSKMRLPVAPLVAFLPCTCPTSDLMDPHLATIFFNLLPSAARCPLSHCHWPVPVSVTVPGWNQSRGSVHTGQRSLTHWVAGQAFTNITTTPPAPLVCRALSLLDDPFDT